MSLKNVCPNRSPGLHNLPHLRTNVLFDKHYRLSKLSIYTIRDESLGQSDVDILAASIIQGMHLFMVLGCPANKIVLSKFCGRILQCSQIFFPTPHVFNYWLLWILFRNILKILNNPKIHKLTHGGGKNNWNQKHQRTLSPLAIIH